MNEDTSSGRLRPVLIGLGALVGASLLIGAVVSAVALGVAGVAGVGGDGGDQASAEPSLYMPTPSPTGDPGRQPAATEPPASPRPSAPATTKAPVRRAITLVASPASVPSYGRIDLTGSYPTGEGANLQVQRFDGGWVDFPVTATVSGGTFSTYIQSGQTGRGRFRVVDTATGVASRPAVVTIG